MRIAVAAGADKVCAHFEESTRLCLVETEGERILRELPGPDPMGFARAALDSGCEAVACGKITDEAVFEALASQGMTRYMAAGLGVLEAARAADARYRQTVLTAFVQVGDALQALADDGEAIAAQTRAEAQAAESLRLAKIAFDKGGGTMIDVLDAQRQLNQAQAARMRLQGQRLADLVRLFAASGADWRGAGKG